MYIVYLGRIQMQSPAMAQKISRSAVTCRLSRASPCDPKINPASSELPPPLRIRVRYWGTVVQGGRIELTNPTLEDFRAWSCFQLRVVPKAFSALKTFPFSRILLEYPAFHIHRICLEISRSRLVALPQAPTRLSAPRP
jgi:hypothetical protein